MAQLSTAINGHARHGNSTAQYGAAQYSTATRVPAHSSAPFARDMHLQHHVPQGPSEAYMTPPDSISRNLDCTTTFASQVNSSTVS